MTAKRVIVIGDVHGCPDELRQLLEKANVSANANIDRVILAGDLIDRGPDSHEVCRLARESHLEIIQGNHDEKHIRARKHFKRKEADPKYKVPIRFNEYHIRTHQSLTDEDIAFLEAAPYYIRIGKKFIVVHGGLAPGRPEDQDPKLMLRRRYVDSQTAKPLSLGPGFSQPEGSVYWTDFWKGPECILYGHTVHSLGPEPKQTFSSDGGGPLTVGLDTGACFGGHLTAAILMYNETVKDYLLDDFVSVKSKGYIDFDVWSSKMKGEAE